MSPTSPPKNSEIAVMTKPTKIEMRMPYSSRLNVSRPSWSVPSRCSRVNGGANEFSRSCWA
jgi:hypothetical protein